MLFEEGSSEPATASRSARRHRAAGDRRAETQAGNRAGAVHSGNAADGANAVDRRESTRRQIRGFCCRDPRRHAARHRSRQGLPSARACIRAHEAVDAKTRLDDMSRQRQRRAPNRGHLTKQRSSTARCATRSSAASCAPGERLVIDDLARRYRCQHHPRARGDSAAAVRGLVVSVPHVGATVAPISRDSVLEVFTMLEGLELVALAAAAERATAAEFDELSSSLVRAMDDAIADERAATLGGPQHASFISPSAASAGMPVLQQMMQRALDRWDRRASTLFQRRARPRARRHRRRREHRLIVAAPARARPRRRSKQTMRAAQSGRARCLHRLSR